MQYVTLLDHTVVFHLGAARQWLESIPQSLLGAAVALLLAARKALILGLHGLLWKVSAPSTKGFNLKSIINEGER